jgi:hypothetical protein
MGELPSEASRELVSALKHTLMQGVEQAIFSLRMMSSMAGPTGTASVKWADKRGGEMLQHVRDTFIDEEIRTTGVSITLGGVALALLMGASMFIGIAQREAAAMSLDDDDWERELKKMLSEVQKGGTPPSP